VLFWSAPTLAQVTPIPYYGTSFYSDAVYGSSLSDKALIRAIRTIVSQAHLRRDGQMDEVGGDACDTAQKDCYQHTPIGYKTARKVIMGELHLVGDSSIAEVYCQKPYTADDFKGNQTPPGHDVIPSNTVINVEHTWPQSRFNSDMDTNSQKSDLHHLFPADSGMNSIRGNKKFGEVAESVIDLPCSTSKMGPIPGYGEDYFEPPNAHKGNVARALFYFSVRYQIHIDDEEEEFLKKWNQLDPVDAEEVYRNDEILRIQGNRNPFIDFPELADRIQDF
jgi:endonuclease I